MNTFKAKEIAQAILLALTMLVVACPVQAKDLAAPAWIASWTASAMSGATPPDAPAILKVPVESISGQTIRQRVTLSKGGLALRIKFTNEFGTKPVQIGAASVAYRDERTGETKRVAVTFGNSQSVAIPAGAPILSDQVSLITQDGSTIAIDAFFPNETPVTTLHQHGLQAGEVTPPGNFTMSDAWPGGSPFTLLYDPVNQKKSFARAFLSEVDVTPATAAKTIVALGDSITDGYGSTPDMNNRWPDFLNRRIQTAGKPFAIVNQGISGNQVLANGAGQSALARFDRDVLAPPGVRTIILLEGINDIVFSGGLIPGISRPDIITADEVIGGYRQLIARAHAHGLRILGGTLTPFESTAAPAPAKEQVRLAVNQWIRGSKEFDGVIDFDEVIADSPHPNRMKPEYDSGDHIHPNDAGYAAMAAVIDLGML